VLSGDAGHDRAGVAEAAWGETLGTAPRDTSQSVDTFQCLHGPAFGEHAGKVLWRWLCFRRNCGVLTCMIGSDTAGGDGVGTVGVNLAAGPAGAQPPQERSFCFFSWLFISVTPLALLFYRRQPP